MVEYFIVMDWDERLGKPQVIVYGRERHSRGVHRSKIVPVDNIESILDHRYKDRALVGWKRRSTAEKHCELSIKCPTPMNSFVYAWN